MPFPDSYTTFSEVPANYPLNYSELTDDVFIWASPNRTLTEILSQAQIDQLAQSVSSAVQALSLQSIVDRIDLHDEDIKSQLTHLDSSIRQIIANVVNEVNENQYLIETIKGDKIKIII